MFSCWFKAHDWEVLYRPFLAWPLIPYDLGWHYWHCKRCGKERIGYHNPPDKAAKIVYDNMQKEARQKEELQSIRDEYLVRTVKRKISITKFRIRFNKKTHSWVSKIEHSKDESTTDHGYFKRIAPRKSANYYKRLYKLQGSLVPIFE